MHIKSIKAEIKTEIINTMDIQTAILDKGQRNSFKSYLGKANILTHSQRLVSDYLINMYKTNIQNGFDAVRIENKDIANDIGSISISSINKALRRLKDLGFISIIHKDNKTWEREIRLTNKLLECTLTFFKKAGEAVKNTVQTVTKTAKKVLDKIQGKEEETPKSTPKKQEKVQNDKCVNVTFQKKVYEVPRADVNLLKDKLMNQKNKEGKYSWREVFLNFQQMVHQHPEIKSSSHADIRINQAVGLWFVCNGKNTPNLIKKHILKALESNNIRAIDTQLVDWQRIGKLAYKHLKFSE